jgi:hypothetical protein
MGVFTIVGTVRLLFVDRRLWHPLSWIRLSGWALSYVFEAVPLMAVACVQTGRLRGYEDPTWLRAWLDGADPSAGTIPAFSMSLAARPTAIEVV